MLLQTRLTAIIIYISFTHRKCHLSLLIVKLQQTSSQRYWCIIFNGSFANCDCLMHDVSVHGVQLDRRPKKNSLFKATMNNPIFHSLWTWTKVRKRRKIGPKFIELNEHMR